MSKSIKVSADKTKEIIDYYKQYQKECTDTSKLFEAKNESSINASEAGKDDCSLLANALGETLILFKQSKMCVEHIIQKNTFEILILFIVDFFN